ncbi:MAG: sulfurtransferase [Betaproteobacteria bacterium]|nr:sulfurtransferase [Betaproteobacteria bacterium]
MLISTHDLSLHLSDPQWVIFDCRHDLGDAERGERLYRQGHLPGAHFAHLDTDLSGERNGSNGRHPLPPPAVFAAFLARHGVTNTSAVVAYDDVGGPYASRLWWMARWIGLRHVYLLDGGLPKWIAEARALSTDVPIPQPVALQASFDPVMLCSAAEVQAHLNDPGYRLIDARAPERYRGDVEPLDPVAGHIPGAINRFYKLNLEDDLTMRPVAEIRDEFLKLAPNTRPENVFHQCGSGVTACMNIFAMEYAGLKGSKLFPGSWSEWVSDPSRPIVGKGN